MHSLIVFSDEVKAAKDAGKPIVALESTVVSHGLPYPQNVETTHAMCAAVRSSGAVPAVIALIDGKIHVGLTEAQLQLFAKPDAAISIAKVNRQNFSFILSRKSLGATTVAGTMMSAALAGIKVFATGGIGGVHRDVAESMDISADLVELSRTPVLVVASGAKSILDINKTLEYLETWGVPVVGHQTNCFPHFYTSKSNDLLEMTLDSADDIRAYSEKHWEISQSGILVANPIPAEDEVPSKEVEKWVAHAMAEAKREGISGRKITPYLLGKVAQISGAKSIDANIALLINNAKVAGQIATST
ncbi:MAG: pseudouridine-5'-phosphate glycosidase [Alphaproteobacteria bacterium]